MLDQQLLLLPHHIYLMTEGTRERLTVWHPHGWKDAEQLRNEKT